MADALTNKAAVISGGSRGIGKAIARGLAVEGCDCLLAARTEAVLQEIINLDDLFSLAQIDPQPVSSYRFLTYKNFLLTLWARSRLGLSETPAALNLEHFRQFYEQLWAPAPASGRIRQTMRESFLHWLATQSGLREDQVSANLAQTLESLFLELEDEYGQVKAKDLDPRFIQHFLIER